MLSKKILCIALSVATVATLMVAPVGVRTESVQAATKLVSKGDLIQNNDFKKGIGLPWTVVETAPAKSQFEIKDGEYKVTVDLSEATQAQRSSKEERWAVQFRHRGLKLIKGHHYRVEYTVTPDHDCQIYAKIGQMDGKYYEFWNGEGQGSGNNAKTWNPIKLKANQENTIVKEFTFTDQDNSPSSHQEEGKCEMAFHLAGDCAPQGLGQNEKYNFVFSHVSVQDDEFPGYEIEYDDTDYAVKTNQIGYFTKAEKKATAVITDSNPVAWKLVDANGKTVKTGKTTVYGEDAASGDYVHKIDFSDYQEEGKGYKIVVDSTNVVPQHDDNVDADLTVLSESPKFDIGSNLYDNMKYQALKYFYYNRSGIDIEQQYTDGFDIYRAAGHKGETLPCVKYEYDGVTPSWYKGNYKLNISGGWYDAGDHGKYVVNGGISTWTLQNQYERALNAGEDMTKAPFADKTLNIPESGNGNPDILDEARWNVELMLKMQVPDGNEYAGMVHHKAHDEKWTALGMEPKDDTQPRFLQPPSTAATLNMAAVAAQASRLWKTLDPTFSAKCLAASKKAYAAAQKHPKIYAPIKGGVGGGAYGDKNATDEFYWAAAELYATTGDSTYLNDAKKKDENGNTHYLEMTSVLNGGEDTDVSGCFDWGNVAGLGTLSLLASKNDLPAADLQTAKDNVTKAADVFVDNEEKQGYGTPITESQTVDGIPGYPWGSNSFVTNTMITLGYANDINNKHGENPKYLNGANRAMDYILGANANTKCYVTGYGTKPLTNPHHRFWAYQVDPKFPHAPAGVISGGPNSGLEDPWVKGSGWHAGERPAAKCYMDNIESWSTNECTINWNAPFAWAASYLDDHNGRVIPYGDINGDGLINVADYSLFRKYFNAGGEEGNIKIVKANADVNQDGTIDFFDLVALKALI